MNPRPSLTLAWATDVHLDSASPAAMDDFCHQVRGSNASVLLLGGDISTAMEIEGKLTSLTMRTGAEVYFVLGNHDYYGGSIAEVRQGVEALDCQNLQWLARTGPHELAPGIQLVGNGGWGDARIGDFAGSNVVLNDYVVISELHQVFDSKSFGVFGEDTPLEAELRRLGREAADSLAPQILAAARNSEQVVVLTHVPPFREACWHEGQISSETWLPGFTCGAMGEMLAGMAVEHPACQFTVLCGHTHGSGVAQIKDNLVVHTQAAEYGRPGFVLLDVNRSGVELHSPWRHSDRTW